MKWWAGWIREQKAIEPPVRTPADAYLAALQRIPLAVEWVNSSPRYVVYPAQLDSTSFDADIRALREGFENNIPTLSVVHAKHLRGQLGKLLEIDKEGFKRRREWFERQEYGLDFLPEDYPALRFEVADDPDGLQQGQWVGPSFWTDIIALLQYKQDAARSAFEKLNAVLPIDESQPVPEPLKRYVASDTTPPQQPPVASYPWAEIEALAEQIKLRKDGRFLVVGNKIAAAGAGFIDALLDAGILPATLTRPVLYAEFTRHYGQPIQADRTKPTRTTWHQKARQELGLPDLKPPKKQA